MISLVFVFCADSFGSARLVVSQIFRIGLEHGVYPVLGMDLGEARLACFPSWLCFVQTAWGQRAFRRPRVLGSL